MHLDQIMSTNSFVQLTLLSSFCFLFVQGKVWYDFGARDHGDFTWPSSSNAINEAAKQPTSLTLLKLLAPREVHGDDADACEIALRSQAAATQY